MHRTLFSLALYLGACVHAQEIVTVTLTAENASRLEGGYDASVSPHCTVEVPIRTPEGIVCYASEDHAQQSFEGPFTFYQRALENTGVEDLVGSDGHDWSERLDDTVGFSREYVALCRTEILNSCDLVKLVHPDWEYFSANGLISALVAEDKGFPNRLETFMQPIPSREEFELRVKEFLDELRGRLAADRDGVN